MHLRLKPIIKWPAQDELLLTMPMSFRKNFKTCITIKNYFEVFLLKDQQA